MKLINKIYKVYPQMEFYNESIISKKRLVPYAMISSQKNYTNKCIKTCSRGFRISSNGKEILSVDNIKKYSSVNILVGGSTVFGVGSPNNETSIPSLLFKKTNSKWLNFGVRTGNSFSEYIHLINLLHKAKKIDQIIFLSGLNDLYLSFLYKNETEFDPGFFPNISEFYKKSIFKELKQRITNKLSNNSKNFSFQKDESQEIIINNYKERYKRNFQLISSLEKIYKCKVSFILQPFAPWTEKTFSNNEINVFNTLNSIQQNSDWSKIKKLMGRKSLHLNINKFFVSLSEKFKLNYIDSNNIFNNIKNDCFVDSVHLNENGNKLLTNLIYDKIIN